MAAMYRSRIEYGDASDEDPSKALLLAAERDELYKVRLTRAIDDDVQRQPVREIDLVEASLLQQTQSAH